MATQVQGAYQEELYWWSRDRWGGSSRHPYGWECNKQCAKTGHELQQTNDKWIATRRHFSDNETNVKQWETDLRLHEARHKQTSDRSEQRKPDYCYGWIAPRNQQTRNIRRQASSPRHSFSLNPRWAVHHGRQVEPKEHRQKAVPCQSYLRLLNLCRVKLSKSFRHCIRGNDHGWLLRLVVEGQDWQVSV